MLNKIINHIKSIGYLWIVILSCTLIFEIMGIRQFYQSNNTLDLWIWGLITFVGFYLESIFIIKALKKEALKNLEKYKQETNVKQ